MVSPVGNTVEDSWKNIIAGKSGVRLIDHCDVSSYVAKISGKVTDFDPLLYMGAKDVRRSDVFIHYALAASAQAMQDSGLEITEENAERAGVLIGSGIGGLPLIEHSSLILTKPGPKKISPFFIPASIINMAAGQVSIKYGMKGPNLSIVTACTSSTHSIGQAARIIAYGDADIMLAGGTEMATCELGVGGFCGMRALSTRNDDPEAASRPWDKDRDGFVLGDGAGVLVLESYEHAKARGAKIYAEVAGFGMSADAYHMTAPSSVGGRRAMEIAIADAQLNLTDVDYINAHATSTGLGDESEANAIKNCFADHAYKLAVSSTKSMTGHLLGAAGAIEAIYSILAIRDQVAPPTINLDNPDEGFDLNFVAHTAQERKIDVAISNSFGFGGTNGSLLFKRFVD
jgi:3-oxoacyl-[acyl-carrier-protein] synthase II